MSTAMNDYCPHSTEQFYPVLTLLNPILILELLSTSLLALQAVGKNMMDSLQTSLTGRHSGPRTTATPGSRWTTPPTSSWSRSAQKLMEKLSMKYGLFNII